jgi:tRNA threonylcarbamoyladenosine biosynthesis protein TsaB
MPPCLLALDSSTDELAVAVAAGNIRWTRLASGGARASSHIISLALEGLAACGIGVQDLDAVAFGAGPGAFTGLRCACAVAQGLAFGAGKPVLAIDSLMVVAEDARHQLPSTLGGALWVAMDARMDEIYAACYRFEGGRWLTTSAPALYTLEALAARWVAAPPQALAGNALAVFAGRLPVAGAPSAPRLLDRASALLTLALRGHADGAAIDPALALPLYLRDKVALTTRERAALRGATGVRHE